MQCQHSNDLHALKNMRNEMAQEQWQLWNIHRTSMLLVHIRSSCGIRETLLTCYGNSKYIFCIVITSWVLNENAPTIIILKSHQTFHHILTWKLPNPALGAVSSAKQKSVSSARLPPSAAVWAFIVPHFWCQVQHNSVWVRTCKSRRFNSSAENKFHVSIPRLKSLGHIQFSHLVFNYVIRNKRFYTYFQKCCIVNCYEPGLEYKILPQWGIICTQNEHFNLKYTPFKT